MSWGQRTILIIAGILLLLWAIASTDGYDSNPTLATFQFLAAVGCFFWAARRRQSEK